MKNSLNRQREREFKNLSSILTKQTKKNLGLKHGSAEKSDSGQHDLKVSHYINKSV